jgi:hypothetical protein
MLETGIPPHSQYLDFTSAEGRERHAEKSALYLAGLESETFSTEVQCLNPRSPNPHRYVTYVIEKNTKLVSHNA